jgi:3-hydroxyacyl-[acyl-carrier-protein] dehydratase
MLKDSLYKIISLKNAESTIEAVLEIDKINEIFEGHFPGQSVLPGACMLQMVKEVLVIVLGKTLRLKKADVMRFTRVVDPALSNLISLSIIFDIKDDGIIGVIAKLINDGSVCLKMQGVFVII